MVMVIVIIIVVIIIIHQYHRQHDHRHRLPRAIWFASRLARSFASLVICSLFCVNRLTMVKVSNQCVIAGCKDRKKVGSKFCKKHYRIYQAANYQAQQKEEKGDTEAFAIFTAISNDPVKFRAFCATWENDNPPGVRRKKLVDWMQWKRNMESSQE